MDSVAVPVGPIDVLLIGDCRVAAHMRRDGRFEPESLAAWAGMCRAGTAVLDIGAYSGLFAIAAALLGAYPVAIEPMPAMAARIAANAWNNDVLFPVKQAAASDADGLAQLRFNPAVPLTSGASLARETGAALTVETLRIDSAAPRWSLPAHVAAIKIDVEGHELAVLAGAAELIARDRPRLLVEALTLQARCAVQAALPAYRLAALLDGRNLLLEPRTA